MSADGRVPALCALLSEWRPVDARERAAVATVLDALTRLPRPFDEDAGPVHVTASALVVSPLGLLLHRHKRLGLWLQPGGHLAPAEQAHDAAVREAVEETGVPGTHPASGPQLVHVDVHEAAAGHTHLDLRYLLQAPPVPPAPPPGESQDVAWFDADAAAAIADPGLTGALVALQAHDARWGAH